MYIVTEGRRLFPGHAAPHNDLRHWINLAHIGRQIVTDDSVNTEH